MNFFEQQRDQLGLPVSATHISIPCTPNSISAGSVSLRFQNATVVGWGVAPPKINKVIHNKPATIVFWEDGTKTVVKAQSENYDAEKGIAMAFMKRVYGNKGRYFNDVKKWVK